MSAKVDIFFRCAYGQSRSGNEPRSVMDTIFGDIGEPLRVDDGHEEIGVEEVEEEMVELTQASV